MRRLTKTIILVELGGFAVVVAMLWLDEVLDCPHLLFGAPATPVNWIESLFETSLVAGLGAFVILVSWAFLQRIKHLEGLLPICAGCRRIRSGARWVPVEDYVRQHSEADFTHGLCPECIAKYYEDAGPGQA